MPSCSSERSCRSSLQPLRRAQVQEIIVIAAHLPRLNATAGVIERRERREELRKKARLHFLGDFEFADDPTFGFEFFGGGAALRFDGVGDLVEAHERKRIAVGILETGKDAAPNRCGFWPRWRRVR